MSEISIPARRRLVAAGAAATACIAALGAPSAQALTNCGAAADQVPTATNIAQMNAATICLMNNEREARGLVKLVANAQLNQAAQRHTDDMVIHHFSSHTGSDGSTISTRLKPYYAGFSSYNIGENLYWGGGSFGTPRKAVAWWMNSSGHRANILSATFRDVGVAASRFTPSGGAGGTYTADFGRRA
jgi:uncharacterized protein YkwD